MELHNQINQEKLPQHVAIIMDGNGRWAKQHGKQRVFGHRKGAESVRAITEAAAELGIKHLTLYAFSTENWKRPKAEIEALMGLLSNTIHKEINTLLKNNIRLLVIGDRDRLPARIKHELEEAIEKTAGNKHMDMIIALSYSSRWEIVQAAKKIAQDVEAGKVCSAEVNDKYFEQYLTTAAIPDPELLIRTSGEYRISNFLLWQIAYSELYFTDILWPDFRKEAFYEALLDYQTRERRFGKTSEQINK